MDESVRKVPCADGLIVSANTVVTPYPVYPLGAACLIGALKKRGHRAEHFDLLADGGLDGLEQFLAERSFHFVGISIRNLDTVDSSAPNQFLSEIVKTVECIRQATASLIVLGGPGFSIMPRELMELLGGDYGIVGEGEELLPWLAAELAAGRLPEEKIFYADPSGGVWQPSDLTSSTAKYYVKHGGMLNVQTKRGCPYRCAYCTYPTIEGSVVRYRDPDLVAEEVNRLRDRSGAKFIFFADSYFNDEEERFLEVAEAMIRHGNSLPWCAFFRPADLQRSDLKLLKRSGLAAIELGTDCTTDKTLKAMGKSFTFEEVLAVHERIVAEDIPCAHYVMFGGPGEDQKTLRQGLKNIELLTNSVVFAFVGIRILPGTGIFNRAVEEGIVQLGTPLLEPVFYFSPLVAREEIEEALQSDFAGKIDRIYPCHEFENQIHFLHQMGHTGPLWDFILKKRGG